jgi:NADP-dependent 3-hydroxy acid dehydrogenase YdfG/2-polyprenyl-3-methyl-5-hydroxy-6-metoxy-1,4-benzoquinol methylase
MKSIQHKKVIIIISVSSDIGTALAERYSKQGYTIIGTYYKSTTNISKLKQIPNCYLFFCNINDKETVDVFFEDYKKLNLKWDTFISCTGTQKPIGRFLDCDFEQWSNSIHINSLDQLRIFHRIYSFRNKEKISDVVFFAGPGTNNAISNYTAYALSKITLIKMCEFIDFETRDVNIFLVGPGWTKTKMHYETLNENREILGENYDKTKKFIESGKGTSMDDIFNCITWLASKGKKVSSGRNFSVVHDKWKGEQSEYLIQALKSDYNMYKLRRFKNDYALENSQIKMEDEKIDKSKLSQNEAYRIGTEEQFKTELIKLGPWTSHSLIKDPKHMCFSLSRYKFVAKMLTGKESIMEVGCGDCFGIPIVAQVAKKVLAIDRDPRNVNDAKERLSILKNIEFKHMDMCKAIPQEQFDGIYSIDVLEHLELNQENIFMTNISKSLKEDGICIIGTPNIVAEKFSEDYSGIQHINLKSHDDLKNLMGRYFKNILMFSMNDEIIHTGYAPMAHYLFAIGIGKK